jgi:GntR family transcriptional regulator
VDTERPLVDRLRDIWQAAARNSATLPGEPQLAADLAASRPAVREALARLEAEGLVSRRRGSETTVNRSVLSIGARFDLQVEFSTLIEARGAVAAVDVLDAVVAPLDPLDAALLDAAPEDRAWMVFKRWTADGQPVVVAKDVVPLPPDVDAADLDPERSLFESVRSVFGREAEWEVCRPGAVLAGSERAAALGITESDPLLELTLVGVARTGQTLYIAREHHVPGWFDYGFVRNVRASSLPG